MKDNIIYWIWLQQVLGYGNGKIKKVMSKYSNAKTFYELGRDGWRLCDFLTKRDLTKIESYNFDDAYKIIEQCKFYHQDIIAYDDEMYPERLKNIYDPPCVLYVKGDVFNIDKSIAVSVVGTRSATQESIQISYDFAFDLAKAGIVIISGGALGIDTASHQGALDAGGKTICVLGSGLDVNYPKENSTLRYKITENGTLVSEYPPGTAPIPRNFPVRNRIISALSMGALIVQAGKKSGALITAKLAMEQNRDVFAIPGSIKSELSAGTNNLIKDGAKPVTCPMDIIEEYIGVYPEKFNVDNMMLRDSEFVNSSDNMHKDSDNSSKVDTNISCTLSENAKKVYNILQSDKIHIDEILIKTGLSVSVVLQAITELEIYGLVNSYSGKRYSKNI